MLIILRCLLALAQLILAIVLADEWLVLWGFCRRQDSQLRGEAITRYYRVVFLIAAHNEERVIAGLLKSIDQLDWPSDQLQTWLVADQCTDNTATIAASGQAKVWIRSTQYADGTPRAIGKGHALNELLAEHTLDRSAADVFIILDADVRLPKDYLANMVQVWQQGYPVVQGAAITAQANASSLAEVNSLANRVQHVVQQGRFVLGLPNLIVGNTLLIDRPSMERLHWQLARISPTEEEVKIALVDREIRIGYATHAAVFEEPVHNVADLARQRSRWFRDYILFLTRAGLPLLISSLVTGRWRRAEAVLAHFWMTSHTLELSLIALLVLASTLSGWSLLIYLSLSLLVGKVILMGGLCLAAGLSVPQIFRVARLYPSLIVGWTGGVLLWLLRPSSQGWRHTRHLRGD